MSNWMVPGEAVSAIASHTKRYRSLRPGMVRTMRTPAAVVETFAPARFSPLSNSIGSGRPIHQFGGSIFSTLGAGEIGAEEAGTEAPSLAPACRLRCEIASTKRQRMHNRFGKDAGMDTRTKKRENRQSPVRSNLKTDRPDRKQL